MVLNKKKKGDWGEDLALDFLIKKEYEFITKNYRYSREGEIDIIVQTPDTGTIVFVEVKAGYPGSFGALEEWITPRKRKTIYKIAEAYIYYNKIENKNFRFDAILIEGDDTNYLIKHIEDAF